MIGLAKAFIGTVVKELDVNALSYSEGGNIDDCVGVLRELRDDGFLLPESDFVRIFLSSVRRGIENDRDLSDSDLQWWLVDTNDMNVPDAEKAKAVAERIFRIIDSNVSIRTVKKSFNDYCDYRDLESFSLNSLSKCISKAIEAEIVDEIQISSTVDGHDNKDNSNSVANHIPDNGIVNDAEDIRATKSEAFISVSDYLSAINDVARTNFKIKEAVRYTDESTLSGMELSVNQFYKRLAHSVTRVEMTEMVAWFDAVINHSLFNEDTMIVKSPDGLVDYLATMSNITDMANKISLAGKNVFQKTIDHAGNEIISFTKAGSGLPDVAYLDAGEIKIAYASASNGVDVEQNQFLRHSVEAGFYNSCLKDLLSEYSILKNDLVKKTLKDITREFKCGEDSTVWFGSYYEVRSKDSSSYLSAITTLVNNIALQCGDVNRNDLIDIKNGAQFFASRSQLTRSLFASRLLAFKNGNMSKDDVLKHELTKSDIDKLTANDCKFITRNPYREVNPFFSNIDEKSEYGDTINHLISKVKNYSESIIKQGMHRLAFSTIADSYSDFKIPVSSVIRMMNKLDFVTSFEDSSIDKQIKASHELMTLLLLASEKDELALPLRKEISDVSSTLNGASVPSFDGDSNVYSNGIYASERASILRSFAVFASNLKESITSATGESVDELIELFFGEENKEQVKESIANGSLGKLGNIVSSLDLGASELPEIKRTTHMALEYANMFATTHLKSELSKNVVVKNKLN
ncbi:hypothetical protein C9J27_03680 [Photobacterium kishitanii]|uniref:Uncharacterized protein n=2 Tax=Photobacterium kishitanii TaxID=318456 RepID=A0A2T3KMV6_9GAMM|nr:hypothetical protein C9J27_03680 [Photobacterium kishitanii]